MDYATDPTVLGEPEATFDVLKETSAEFSRGRDEITPLIGVLYIPSYPFKKGHL